MSSSKRVGACSTTVLFLSPVHSPGCQSILAGHKVQINLFGVLKSPANKQSIFSHYSLQPGSAPFKFRPLFKLLSKHCPLWRFTPVYLRLVENPGLPSTPGSRPGLYTQQPCVAQLQSSAAISLGLFLMGPLISGISQGQRPQCPAT